MQFTLALTAAVLKEKNYSFWLPRFFGLLVVPGFLFDVEILVLFQAVIFLHASLGLEVIIDDYVHTKATKYQFLFLAKIFSILLVNLHIFYLL
uniref:Succinate:cytochrome c oxidoreductase subunit 4 n=1 Tax=Wildemania schizophylla TaxID=1134705 RepID=A0A068EYV4_WILSC|nr:succinate:cytochrome c oxidoreductase subunit 4 [Wildemania schizophylla]AID57253.1 succinate:cytochrome c oxidoreductase subunit 4 [Wildemania schizophylla]